MSHRALYRILPGAALAALLCACAHPSTTHSQQDPKQGTAMTTSTNQPPAGQITIHDYPELTPDEVGRRFLKLVDSLGTGRNLTLEHVRAVTMLPIKRDDAVSDSNFDLYHFTSYLPDSGWYFIFNYVEDRSRNVRSASYRFSNINDMSATKMLDMAPVCGLDLVFFRSALLKMGFVEGPPHYDMFQEQRGRLLGYQFTHGATSVGIRPQREGNAPDEKLYHECINGISVTSAQE
jgi:hypothetical protein